MVRLQPSKLPVKSVASNNASQDSLAVPTNIVTRASPPPPEPAAIAPITHTIASLDDVTDENERKWILRLRELEKRLKAEREARLLDRTGAKQRLEEARGEREQLKKELERERTISRFNRQDEEDEEKKRRTSMIPKPKALGASPGGRAARDGVDDNTEPIAPDYEDVRSLIVRVERERRAKSRDRHKSHERRYRDTPDERDLSRDGRGSGSGDGRLRDRERDKLRERNGLDRVSSNRSSTTKRTDSTISRKVPQVSSIDELNARMERAKSPPTVNKKENSTSPRKFLGFSFGGKSKENE